MRLWNVSTRCASSPPAYYGASISIVIGVRQWAASVSSLAKAGRDAAEGRHAETRCAEAFPLRGMTQPVVAVVLHLRSRYVSKAAILKGGCRAYPFEIEVPLEFQGLGS